MFPSLNWFQGTTYVYDSFFRPYVAKHETEIDRNLLELRIRAGDVAVSYWQKVAIYGQTRVFDILQYIAAQSSPPRPVQVCIGLRYWWIVQPRYLFLIIAILNFGFSIFVLWNWRTVVKCFGSLL